jgi:hypothetical protein
VLSHSSYRLLMSRTAIFATIALSLLASVNMAVDAKEPLKYNRSSHDSRLDLIAKPSKANVSQADLRGISQAVNLHFKNKNNREMLSCQSNGGCFFVVVTSLKLVSFGDDNAQILFKVDTQGYRAEKSGAGSSKWLYEKTSVQLPANVEHMMLLKKTNGKWQVTSSVV